MSPRDDLTRWNRAGLSRFRYVDGNAAEYLEILRQAFADKFGAQWAAVQPTTDLSTETYDDRVARVLDQYHAERGDWAWEIARTFARACHILAGHIDAYANESYIQTATQWENVRRLVELLDYHPAPPASASTWHAFRVKQGKGSFPLSAGFQTKYTPPAGDPLVFETLSDLVLDETLNELRLKDWSRSQETLSKSDVLMHDDGKTAVEWVWPSGAKFSTGDQALVMNGSDKGVAAMLGFSQGAVTIEVVEPAPSTSGWNLADTRLLVRPKVSFKPYLNGPDVFAFSNSHGLRTGALVAWNDVNGDHIARVIDFDDTRIELDAPPVPAVSQVHFVHAYPVGRFVLNNQILIPKDVKIVFFWDSVNSLWKRVPDVDIVDLVDGDQPNWFGFLSGGTLLSQYKKIANLNIDLAYMVPPASTSIGGATRDAGNQFLFAGDPGTLASGDWVNAAFGDPVSLNVYALKVSKVVKDKGSFSLVFDDDTLTKANGAGLRQVYGRFEKVIFPRGYDQNLTSVKDAKVTLELAASQVPATLKAGRDVLFEGVEGGKVVKAYKTQIVKVDTNQDDPVVLHVDPSIRADDGFTSFNTRIRANVVESGHGETKPEVVLGSGDATQTDQSFLLKAKKVSFVADATMSRGVAADIVVHVGDQKWKQVPNLAASGPADPHYWVEITEENYLRIRMGDGKRGRRLPTGTNNVRVSYRTGNGQAGVFGPGLLEKAVKPHPLIDKIEQLLATTGGNDAESADDMRVNAPGALLALERAVSLEDFARMAAHNSHFWQARAFSQNLVAGRYDSIEVVVVPSGGGPTGTDGEDLQKQLKEHCLPGVDVQVTRFQPLYLNFAVTVGVKSTEFDPDLIVSRAKQALHDAFRLKTRKLGQPFFVSEIIGVVDVIPGVEYSYTTLSPVTAEDESWLDDEPDLTQPTESTLAFHVGPKQVLYLDLDHSQIDVQSEEYRL